MAGVAGAGVRATIDGTKAWRKAERKANLMAAKGIQNALRKEIRQATKATRYKIRDEVRASLPKSGGLNKWAGRVPSVSVNTQGRRQGVKITLKRRGADMQALNRGVARHPVYGNRRVWANTPVTPRWFDKAAEKDGPRLKKEMRDGMKAALENEWRKP